MDLIGIIQLFGGVGLFLYGMSLMGSSLERLAGSKLEGILGRLTTSRNKSVGLMKGFGLGTGVTVVIQSSAATTMMLIGFVNAGIMKFEQSIPVVFGANVGSTVTAQILRLGDIASDNPVLQLLKPSVFAPILVAVGAVIFLFTKKKKTKAVASLLIGLGTLFYGMTSMEEVFEPLRESESFKRLFTSFENPLIGIIIGLVVTAIIQSSSASVGILQALSATGSISYGIAIPIIIGQNLGKCMTVLLGAIGANKKAKKVSLSYLLFNIFGALFFVFIIYGAHYTVGLSFMEKRVNMGNVANIHLLFNLLTGIMLLPFSDKMAEISSKLVRDEGEDEIYSELDRLDERLLQTPVVAVAQCKEVLTKMFETAIESYKTAVELVSEYSDETFSKLLENENFIDRCETVLSGYIIRIDRAKLDTSDKRTVTEILNSIGDIERIGDHIITIAYAAMQKDEEKIEFTNAGARELRSIGHAVDYSLEQSYRAYMEADYNAAVRTEIIEGVVEELRDIIKQNHLLRLQSGTCSTTGGAILIDMIAAGERISAYAANVAQHVAKSIRDDNFDEMHGKLADTDSDEYKALYAHYRQEYIDALTAEEEAMAVTVAEEETVESYVNQDKKNKKKDKEKAKKKEEKKEEKKKDGKEAKGEKEKKKKK